MNHPFDLEMPCIIEGRTRFNLLLFDEGLHGSQEHFLRLDLYPLLSPSFTRRHYGWWDIPLEGIRRQRTELSFDFSTWSIRVETGQEAVAIPAAWKGPSNESGYCRLHLSLWNNSSPPLLLGEIQSYDHVILTEGLDLPFKQLNLPVTDRCNLKCPMCPKQGTQKSADMDIPDDVLQQLLLDLSPEVCGVLVQGTGEPLLYGDLCNVIRLAKSRISPDGEVGITTNATLLNDSRAAELMETGLDFIYFSIDGASKQTYESIRIGASFEAVISNIRRCVHYRNAQGLTKPRFMMNFVIMGRNYREIPDYVALAAYLGVEQVTLSVCIDNQSGAIKAVPEELLGPVFDQAKKIASTRDIMINYPPLRRARQEMCLFMERMCLETNGNVYACHAMLDGYASPERRFAFGNVREMSLQEIWNKPAYREFRRRVLTGDFPPSCVNCEIKAYLVP